MLADAQGARVAAYLLEATDRGGDGSSYLVVGNGSAMRTEKAPGHLDERAEAFDAALGRVAAGRATAPSTSTWPASCGRAWTRSSSWGSWTTTWAPHRSTTTTTPYGVQYWVVRWTSDS